MARTDTLGNFLTDVADAIREKKGITDTIPASEFDTEISSIETGGGTEEGLITYSDFNEYGYPTKATLNRYLYVNNTPSIPQDLFKVSNSTTYPNYARKGYHTYITEIVCPDTDEGVYIMPGAFAGSTAETLNIKLPKNIRQVYDAAFQSNKAIETIDLSSLTGRLGLPDSNSSNVNVFYDCTNLKTVILPDTLAVIGRNTFYKCVNLDFDKLPSSLTTLYYAAFYGCSSLSLSELPESLTMISDSVFYNCTSMTISKLPSNLKQIGYSAFYGCTNITISELPETLTKLDTAAFLSCNNITTMIVPSGITTIATQVFNACNGLTEITWLGDITTIGAQAFRYSNNLEKIILPNITSVPALSNTNVFADTPIASGTGYIYVPDDLVESIKVATNWSTYAERIKPISELE